MTTSLESARVAPLAVAQPHPLLTGPILVASDGSDASRPAIESAFQLWKLHGTSIRVVAVVPELPAIAWEYGALGAPIDDFSARRDAFLLRVKAQVQDVAGAGAEWPIEIRVGDPAVEIARCATEAHASLIVLGVEHRAVSDRVLAREVSVRLLEPACAPILVAPPGFAGSPMRMAVATDFSIASMRAAVDALTLFPGIASAIVAHVERSESTAMDIIDWMTPDEVAVEDGFRTVEARLLEVRPLRITPVLLRGAPARQVVTLAKSLGADLLVTSASAKGLVERILVGSTSRAMLRHAPCAVLVVPAALTEQAP